MSDGMEEFRFIDIASSILEGWRWRYVSSQRYEKYSSYVCTYNYYPLYFTLNVHGFTKVFRFEDRSQAFWEDFADWCAWPVENLAPQRKIPAH